MTEKYIMTMGERLQKMWENFEITQEQVAERADVSMVHLLRIETGKVVSGTDILMRLSDVFNVSTDEILFESKKSREIYAVEKCLQNLSEPEKKFILHIFQMFYEYIEYKS